MRQIIGLTVQFAAAMKEVKKSYRKKLQEDQMELFGAKCNIVWLVMKGIQQRKNAKTITMAILSTFRFFLDRCFSAFADGSPGWACCLSLIRMIA